MAPILERISQTATRPADDRDHCAPWPRHGCTTTASPHNGPARPLAAMIVRGDASERSGASPANGPPSREALRRGLAVALAEAEARRRPSTSLRARGAAVGPRSGARALRRL